MTKPNIAIRIGVRSLILTAFTMLLAWISTNIISWYSPYVASASAHQFEDSNQAYANARAAATFDPNSVVFIMTWLVIGLVWCVAGYQWWQLSQEPSNAS